MTDQPIESDKGGNPYQRLERVYIPAIDEQDQPRDESQAGDGKPIAVMDEAGWQVLQIAPSCFHKVNHVS